MKKPGWEDPVRANEERFEDVTESIEPAESDATLLQPAADCQEKFLLNFFDPSQ
jgi:hypothetical protein